MAAFREHDLRNAMGCFATGVTVVTTMTADGPLGMTVSSFASVSLDPPLVLWSPARKSARFPAFEAASHFAVHILAENQRDLAKAFAKTGIEAFEGRAYTSGIGDVPVFDQCAARFECRHTARYDGGDHLIVVGEVLRLEYTEKPPLLYFRSAYEKLQKC
ncbi:MAG: flavin reductase family protein [Paracoccaceae bacterium]